jgi:hypothetical protein
MLPPKVKGEHASVIGAGIPAYTHIGIKVILLFADYRRNCIIQRLALRH